MADLLPPAGLPTGLRSEDFLTRSGQQQWWESRDSDRLWRSERPSVAGCISPPRPQRRNHQNNQAHAAVTTPASARAVNTNEIDVQPQQPTGREKSMRYELGLPSGNTADKRTEYQIQYSTRPGVENESKPTNTQTADEEYGKHRLRKAIYHDAQSPYVSVYNKPPREELSTEYSRQFQFSPSKSRTVAVETDNNEKINTKWSSERPRPAPIAKSKRDPHVRIPKHINRESTYVREFQWPTSMTRDTTAKPMASKATFVTEDALDTAELVKLFPFPETEYQSQYTAFAPSIADLKVEDFVPRAADTRKLRVNVGDPGQTRVMVKEYTPGERMEVDSNESDDGSMSTEHDESKPTRQTTTQTADVDSNESDDGSMPLSSEEEEPTNPLLTNQPLEGKQNDGQSSVDDLDYDYSNTHAGSGGGTGGNGRGKVVTQRPAAGYVTTHTTKKPTFLVMPNGSGDKKTFDLDEQSLGSKDTAQVVFSTEYSERFKHPEEWFATTITDEPPAGIPSRPGDVIPLASIPQSKYSLEFHDLRARADYYSTRSHGSRVDLRLGQLASKQNDLLQRARRPMKVHDLPDQTNDKKYHDLLPARKPSSAAVAKATRARAARRLQAQQRN
eukprot:m.11458 g.11458  ORF g.11458 m.11458 type:complete len:616 (-) comp8817_c0_seq1:304-2151(-)